MIFFYLCSFNCRGKVTYRFTARLCFPFSSKLSILDNKPVVLAVIPKTNMVYLLDETGKISVCPLYYVVRSGLTHEYFIKRTSKIEIDNLPGQSLVELFMMSSDPQIVFYVKQYFDDFTSAFEKYYSQLKNDQSRSMLPTFEKALQSINSSLIAKLSKDFREDVSGRTASIGS